MRQARCATCVHFNNLDSTCRQSPPQTMPIQGPRGELAIRSFWPATKPEFWCGQQKPHVQVAE